MNEVRQRIRALRLELLKRNLDAWYISGTDPHNSEYLTARWQTREFISGFTGSYGVVVVTNEEAGLWTDSRYFIQAYEQLKGSGIRMFRLRVPGAISPELWISRKLSPGSKLGFDPSTLSVSAYRNLNKNLVRSGVIMTETPDLLNNIWVDRPEMPGNEIYEFPVAYAGLSRKDKRELVISGLKKHNADLQIVTTMDEVAWLFNLRGSDVSYNPLFTGYGVVGRNEFILFVDIRKVPAKVKAGIDKEKIRLLDYSEFFPWLRTLNSNNIFIDPSSANFEVYNTLSTNNNIIEGISVIALLKAQKNVTELSGFRDIMKKDGVAMTEFLYWLKQKAGKSDITEYTAGCKLGEFRSGQEGYIGESFAPIVGYKEHGAIIHLTVSPENALPIKAEGILLFDSGGHYKGGTTDITRTVALGNITGQQKIDFTLVLKGMIALTTAKFPKSTRGCNLDILARKALWERGLNYGHGTGHGVGHFLNVHEGPASIRQELNDTPVLPGMVMSNEPGLYREGKYGIRIENLILCTEEEETPFGSFLGFETLTLCPVDTSLIEISLLDNAEKVWLNNYHKRVREELKPILREGLHEFLDKLTEEIK
jgi:Xaa-Pro aminopeptidase